MLCRRRYFDTSYYYFLEINSSFRKQNIMFHLTDFSIAIPITAMLLFKLRRRRSQDVGAILRCDAR